MVDCSLPGLDREWLEDLSREARRDFGEGYHMLASLAGGRIYVIFDALHSDEIEEWLFMHGADVRTIAAIDAEAEHGLVETHA